MQAKQIHAKFHPAVKMSREAYRLKDARDLDRALAGAAVCRLEDAEVVEPGAAVELGVDGLERGCLLAVVSMAMMPVTCCSGLTVPGLLETQRMKTASQLFQVLRIWKGIGAWPLWPAMKALREVKVGWPS